LAGALAAFYRRIPIGHVEAGLRTHNLDAPYPEEANRQLVARLASWHFSPTQEAVNNLIEEGIDPSRIRITGNTIVDSLRLLEERHFQEHTNRDLESNFSANIPFVLVTLHRRENLEQGMPSILDAVRLFAETHLNLHVLFPMHPNPAVRTLANQYLEGCSNVKLVEPMGYPNFIAALRSCLFVLTDSGGIQEEAVSLGKIAVVARNTSERLDSRAEGRLILSGTSTESVLFQMNKVLLQTGMRPTSGSLQASVFGDGYAAEKIAELLAAELRNS
jgi:UDP-N-acetylglucosamine 2-epimerase (non-hydrolysing)